VQRFRYKDVIQIVSEGKVGLVVVLDGSRIAGVIQMEILDVQWNSSEEFFSIVARDSFAKNPKMIAPYKRLPDAQRLMEKFKVNSLLVSNSRKELIGIVRIYDLGF